MKVAQYANNALTNKLTFTTPQKRDADDPTPNIVQTTANDGEVLTIKIGYGLLITNNDDARGESDSKLLPSGAPNDTDELILTTVM